jgi:hypothetical protein
VAGAAVFQIDDWDREVADWARREQPIFGNDAAQWSDDLRSASSIAYVATVLLTPGGDDPASGSVTRQRALPSVSPRVARPASRPRP